MKTGKNHKGNLLVWLDDGTEIIFSEHATEAITARPTEIPFGQAVQAVLISVSTPSTMKEDLKHEIDTLEIYCPEMTEEEPEGCDLTEAVGELREVVEANLETQKNVLNANLMLSEEMLKMRRDMETINRKVDSLASVVIGDGSKNSAPKKSVKKNNSIFSRG